MSQDKKTEEAARQATDQAADVVKDEALTDAELGAVTGGAKPWLDLDREPDEATFTVERFIN